MSEKEKINWEEFRKKLEEKGYLEPGKKSFFINFSLKSLSFFQSLLRLSFLFSILSSFVISLIITIAISFFQKKAIPVLFIYYFPIFFILFFGIIPLTSLILRIKHFKSPSLFSLYSSLILAIFCSLLIQINFSFFIQKNLRISSFFLMTAIFFVIFFKPFKILSLLSWKEIPFNKLRRINLFALSVLLLFSILGSIAIFLKSEKEFEPIAVKSNYNKLAVIAVDVFPLNNKLFEEISLKDKIEKSMIFKLKIKEYKDPPIFWTEISTGFPPEENGFLSLKTYKLPFIEKDLYPLPLSFILEKLKIAKESISTSGVRKKRSFWEISSLFGRHSLSLNWWASWQPLENSCQVISNLYFIKALKGEKGNEYQIIEPIDLKKENLPKGFQWNKFVFDTLKERIKDYSLITIYFPGIDVQVEEMKKENVFNFFENSKYIEENFQIIKNTIELLIERNFKIIFISYSGRNKDLWGWGFLYPNQKNMEVQENISPYSITPTILKILNLPISKKFPEKPIQIPFETFEEYYIEDYQPIEREKSQISPPPLEELKSLGYLQ